MPSGQKKILLYLTKFQNFCENNLYKIKHLFKNYKLLSVMPVVCYLQSNL